MQEAQPAPPLVTRLVEAAAARLGYDFTVLDAFGYLVEVRNGEDRVILIGGVSPANPLFAGRLCKDKYYAGVVLERAGYRVPRSVRCLSPRFFRQPDYVAHASVAPGLALAREIHFPLVVKPNRLSKGIGVAAVSDAQELTHAVQDLWEDGCEVVLVQERIAGRDLRLNFVDDEFIGGYERSQLTLRGDGARTVRELLSDADPRGQDEAFVQRVGAQLTGLTLDDVLPAGEVRALGSDTVLNLNQLATARVIEEIPGRWLDHCLGVGRAVGATHFGIDVRAPGLEADPASMIVVEVNDSPLLTGLYELGYEELAIAGQAKALALAFTQGRRAGSGTENGPLRPFGAS